MVYYSLFLTESASDRRIPAKNSCYHRITLSRKVPIMVDAFRQKRDIAYCRYLWCVHACRKESTKHNVQTEGKENLKERSECINVYLFSALYCLHGIKQLESILSVVVLMYKNHC